MGDCGWRQGVARSPPTSLHSWPCLARGTSHAAAPPGYHTWALLYHLGSVLSFCVTALLPGENAKSKGRSGLRKDRECPVLLGRTHQEEMGLEVTANNNWGPRVGESRLTRCVRGGGVQGRKEAFVSTSGIPKEVPV